MKLLIQNGRVIDPASNRDEVSDILVVDGVIESIGKIEPDDSMEVLDATGKLVMPGVIDLHVHLRDMGQSAKETIATGTQAALAGGVTTVLAMPNTVPRLDTPETIARYQLLIDKDAVVTVMLSGSITQNLDGEALGAIDDYPALGIRFITDDGHDIDDEAVLKQAFEKATELDLAVMIHPEIMHMPGVMNEGKVSQQLGVTGQPNEKEWKAVERGIRLAAETGARVHFTHITTQESVALIRAAKKETDKVTCDTTAHHIALTEDVILSCGALGKVNPPLRTEDDRMALIEGLKDGTIDCLITDHAPHTEEEKSGDIAQAAFGFSEIELLLPVVLTELHYRQGMTLMDVVHLLTSAPADLAQLPVGRLSIDAPADIAIVDLDTEKTVDRHQLISKGKNTPFHGQTLKGWPLMTLVRGKLHSN